MRTKDLIGALVADLPRSTTPFKRIFAGALALGALVALGAFWSFVGLRPDIGQALENVRFLLKFVFALALLVAAVGLLSRLAVPGAPTGRWAFGLLAAPALLALAAAVELVLLPVAAWRPSLVGSNARLCLTLIPFLALGPLTCLLLVLRRGAPSEPGLTGAVAGLVSGALAATLYASHCNDDSPLFVAVWYSLAIAIVASAGYVIGARLLRW